MFLILVQLALLAVTAWGWGFWVGRLLGTRALFGWRARGWFFLGLAGFMTCVLFLYGLVYLDLPLKFTSWAGLLVAVAGLAGSVWQGRWQRDLRRRWREPLAAGLLFAAVFGCQSIPLFHSGPSNYYGSAHTDQVNYVLLAEFLVEKPFSMTPGEVGLEPWTAKPLTLKNARIGQSVANGYLGVVSFSDAKRSYGTLSIAMVALGALGVFFLARVLSLPLVPSALVALWWGVLPAATKMHLDGFFSQTCVLFIFPLLGATFFVRRGRLERTPLVLLTIDLAYLLCAYTEVYILGLAILVCLMVLVAEKAAPWWRRGAAVAAVVAGSLVLNAGYLRYFAKYIRDQYHAAAVNPKELVDLMPMSGTWIGWKQIFFGYDPLGDARLERLSLLAGFAFLFLIVCAFQTPGLAKRRFLLAIIAPPAGVLALLLSAAEFAKYPFAKLLDTFTPFWLVLTLTGAQALAAWLVRHRAYRQTLLWAGGVLLVTLALRGSWPQWRDTMLDKGILTDVDAPGARVCYRQARRDPSSVYLVDEHHALVCAWLTYAARHSQVYVDADQISDLPVPYANYPFRRLPEPSRSLVVLNEKGPSRMKASEHPPLLVVNNPQNVDGAGEDASYWLGPDAALELVDNASPPDGPAHQYTLVFDATAGPDNPVPERTLVLIGPGGKEQKVTFTNGTRCRFTMDVRPGKNSYTLRVAYPTEQTSKIPGDPRIHLVQIRHLAIVAYAPLQ